MIHYRSIRLKNNAGMDFPQCFASAKLLDTEKSKLATSGSPSEVTCGHCLDYLGLSGKIRLTWIRLNSQGYTDKGKYFGVGMPLFYFTDEDGERCDYIRAYDRDDAKVRIRAKYPDARFYR